MTKKAETKRVYKGSASVSNKKENRPDAVLTGHSDKGATAKKSRPAGAKRIVRRRSSKERQMQILEIARDLIFNEGFSTFTIREVAGRVGISEAAIYRHFANKEELMLALLESLFAPWREAIARLVAEDLHFSNKLEELCRLHLHHLLDERLNPVLFLSEAVNPQHQRLLANMRANLGFLRQSVAEIVVAGVKKRQVRNDIEPEAVTAAVLGMLQNAVIKWTLQRRSDALVEEGARNMSELARALQANEVNK